MFYKFITLITLNTLIYSIEARLPDDARRWHTVIDHSDADEPKVSIEKLEERDFDPSVVILDKEPNKDVVRPFKHGWDSHPILPFNIGNLANIFFQDNHHHKRSWWRGPNVCIKEEVKNEEANESKNYSTHFVFNLHTTTCSESESSYACTTTTRSSMGNKTKITRYECCHGFARKNDETECVKVEIKNLVHTLEDIGAAKTGQQIDQNLASKAEDSNFTIFAVTDESLVDYEDYNKKENEISPLSESAPMKEYKQSNWYTIPGVYKTDDLHDEQILETIDGRTLRINFYAGERRIVTGNCARLVSRNNVATNGVVHLFDKIVMAPEKSLIETMNSNPELSIFKELLEKTDLVQKLDGNASAFTVFAPTNAAFVKLGLLLDEMKEGKGCFDSIIRSHIVARTLCSTALSNEAKLRTISESIIPVERNYDNKIFINGGQILIKDILTTNGIIHVIDKVIVPEKAQPFSKAIQTNPLMQGFYKLIANDSKLMEELDSREGAIFFVPSNEAFDKISSVDLKDYKNIANYHVVGSSEFSNLFNDKKIETANGKQIRINLYSDFPGMYRRATAECSRILSFNNEVCGGNILMVDRLLVPPKGNLIDSLDELQGSDIMHQIIKNTKLYAELKNTNHSFTLLVPSDTAFERHMTETQIKRLVNNEDGEGEKLVKRHIVPEILCCAGLESTSGLFNLGHNFQTLDGSYLSAHKDFMGRIKVGNGIVTTCDIPAMNGVIHTINRVNGIVHQHHHHGLQDSNPFNRHPILRIFFP